MERCLVELSANFFMVPTSLACIRQERKLLAQHFAYTMGSFAPWKIIDKLHIL